MSADDDREKTAFEQNFQQLRVLNEQLLKIPGIAITLTGGLWFGAGLKDSVDPMARAALLLFAGAANVALVVALLRVRQVFAEYLEKLKDFHPASFPTGASGSPKSWCWQRSRAMVRVFVALMGVAALLSVVGACGVLVNARGAPTVPTLSPIDPCLSPRTRIEILDRIRVTASSPGVSSWSVTQLEKLRNEPIGEWRAPEPCHAHLPRVGVPPR